MATTYTINGTQASLAPISVRWRQLQVGRDHTQRAIYSGNWEIDMTFPPASMSWGQQWLEAASSGSANITILDRFSIGFTDLSSIQLEISEYPAIENVNFMGWSMVVRGASPNT